MIAERVSRVCLLGSPPSDIRARAVHLAERLLAPNAEKWKEGWPCADRALAAYRAGDRDDAVKWALATPDGSWYHPAIMAEFVIAMAVYREGRPEEARLWLELARGRLETHRPGRRRNSAAGRLARRPAPQIALARIRAIDRHRLRSG